MMPAAAISPTSGDRAMNSSTPTVPYTRGNDLSGSLEGAGGIGGLLARSDQYSVGSWNRHVFCRADGNGNVTALATSAGMVQAFYRYDPYGRATYTCGPLGGAKVYRFSSKMLHGSSGLYYYGLRFYDSNLQRWLNRDPLGDDASMVYVAASIGPRVGPRSAGETVAIIDSPVRREGWRSAPSLRLSGKVSSSPTSPQQLHSQRDWTWAAEPSRSQPSSWAWSLSCWPRKRGTATNRHWTSGKAVMSTQSFSNWLTGKMSSWPWPQRFLTSLRVI
ncbi:MAG: hypothetical protein FJ387_13610 [Verrucomicrobia bacterium]|nr:hypothetical protein [Verrucomicrobiota bacterium]